jgi:predicted permease
MLSSSTRTGEQRNFSEQEIREIKAKADGFADLTILGYPSYTLVEPGHPAERVRGLQFSGDMMATFGIQPIVGRAFAPDEFSPGKTQVVLLQEGFWRSRFGGDPGIVGKTLRLDSETVTVIGVLPARFDYKLLWGTTALVRPLEYTKDQLTYRNYRAFTLLGRLKPGVNSAIISAQLAPVAADQEKAFPQDYAGIRYRTLALHEATIDDVGRNISWLLLGLSGFILLIACANLANLQLARATAAAREFAIRAALGASRGRLIAQQLTECVVLSVAGGALGWLVALWVNNLLERAVLIDGSAAFRIPIDGTVLGLTLLVSLLTGAVFGIVPALFASRTDVNATLKSQSRGSTSGRGHNRMRQALIIGEIALALVLLGGAAIMNRGFGRMLHRETGWDMEHILTGIISLPEARYDAARRVTFYRELETKLAALPGVDNVTLTNVSPLYNYYSEAPVFIDAPAAGAEGAKITASQVLITPTYFATLGIPLLEGRGFAADVKRDGPRQIVINEKLAKAFWPGESAVGKRLGTVVNNANVWLEVIGVVGHTEAAGDITKPRTELYLYSPLVQEPWAFMNVMIRSRHPAALADTARRAVSELDADLALDRVGTIPQQVDRNQHNLIVVGYMLAGFAALGLVLASVGLYGVISHLVSQRTGEFGIRLALGATPRDMLSDVLLRGMRLAGIGLLLGLAGAYGLGKFLESFMPRLAASDPFAIVDVAGLLLAVALLACWFPARRAMKVDPITALRAE